MLRNVLNQGKILAPRVLYLDDCAFNYSRTCLIRYYYGDNRRAQSNENARSWGRYDGRATDSNETFENGSYSSRHHDRRSSSNYDQRQEGRYTSDNLTGSDISSRRYNNYKSHDKYQSQPQKIGYHPFKRRTWTRKPTVNAPTPSSEPDELIQAIRAAFPHVKNPTSIQAELIPAIHRGSDIILKDATGSGKTFGSVLAMLSESQRPHLGTTTLYIVPHRDLAYQIESWCQKLLPGSSSTESLASHVQVLVRPNVNSSLVSIKNTPPRILIATPGALIDAMLHPEHPLKLHLSLERIIVDEFDVVMNIPLRYRVVRESRRHQPEAAQAIDRILEDIWRMKRPKPQMVMMGATLWLHVRKWLFAQNGWMAEHVVRLDGVKAEQGEDDEIVSSSNDKVVHSAVVVNPDGTLRNARNAGENERGIEPGILTQKPSLVLEALSDDETADTDTHAGDLASDSPPAVASSAPKHSISPSVFEAIATSIAIDVTNRAMCVVPAGTSVIPIVENFCKLGVDARLLNLRDDIEHISRPNDEDKIEISSPTTTSIPVSSQEENISESVANQADEPRHELVSNPVLLVTTTAAVRGLDIPTLSHVYIVGGVESSGLYRHIAGRVGRFGKPGTVVSFIGVIGAESPVGSLAGERRLQNIYKQIGAKVVPFAHIQ